MRILIVEDERAIAKNIAEFLRQHSFVVDIALDGTAGWQLAYKNPYDVVLLDWMLPGIDGMEICKNLRSHHPDSAIIFLTARDTLNDKVEGFDIGADDYLVKPFELRELLVRIHALLRRRYPNKPEDTILKVGDVSFDLKTQEVQRGKHTIRLTRKLMQLLEFLMRNQDQVVSKAEIEAHIWDANAELWSDVVRSHIQKLRVKIDKEFDTKLIQTVHGVGYIMSDHPYEA